MKKPKKPTAQQSTYTVYNNNNTIKVLVGISSTGGMVTHVSPAFGGSTSDRQIVERSKLDKLCCRQRAVTGGGVNKLTVG